MTLTNEHLTTLSRIAQSTANGDTAFVTVEGGQELANQGFLHIDAETQSPNGGFGATVTAAGIEAYNAALTVQSGVPSQVTPPPVTPPTAPPMAPPTAPVIAPVIVHVDEPADGLTQALVPGVVPSAPAETAFAISASHPRPKSSKAGNKVGGQTGNRKSKYPFADLEVNKSFFIPDTYFDKFDANGQRTKEGNAFHSMTSAVAAQNKKHREDKVVGWNPDGTPIYRQQTNKDGAPLFYANQQPNNESIQTIRFKAYAITEVSDLEPVLGCRVFREPLKDTDVHAEKAGPGQVPAPVAPPTA